MHHIDLQKVTPVEYCVLVAWVKGMSTGEIIKTIGKRFNKTPGAIRGIINNKLKIKRADMTFEGRQKLLDVLKDNRMDAGQLVPAMFTAQPIKSETGIRVGPLSQYRIQKETPASDISNKKVKKLSKKQIKAAAAKKKEMEDAERAAREAGLNPYRGCMATPLEYMDQEGLLADHKKARGSIDKSSVEMVRSGAGKKMRELLAGCQMSGLKSQDFEMVGGGGGMGVALPAKMQEYQSKVRAIRGMMSVEDFNDLYAVLMLDNFIWLVPSKRGEAVVLEAIRRSLDAVAVFLGMLQAKAFESKWGYLPVITAHKTRGEARRDAGAAREMIQQAQRIMR